MNKPSHFFRITSMSSSSPSSSNLTIPTLSFTLTESEASFDSSLIFSIFICFIVLLLIFVTLIGNLMVCAAICMVKKLKAQPENLLLISLAVADLGVGIFVMPIALIDVIKDEWILGDVICHFWTSADLTLCTASILNLCMISIDRYLLVTKPLHYSIKRTRKRILFYIAIVWIVALLVSTVPLIFLPWNKIEDNICQVPQNQIYQIYATLISFYGPCLIMVILYYKIWKAAKRFQLKDRTIKTGIMAVFGGEKVSFKDRKNSLEKYEDKALKTLGIIMSVFIICWLPFFILALLKSQQLINGIPKWVDALTLWLGYFNSMLNPLIYCKFNRDFRLPFREMLFCRFQTIQNVIRRESFKSQFGDN